MVLGMSQCDNCQKTIKKGELFALMGEYPSLIRRSFFGAAGGLDQFESCILLCQECFKKKFKEKS
jgi:hypothetical protein